jgi:hypothetical protein
MDSGAWAGFGPRAERFADAGIDWWVCPGTSGWNSLVGRLSNAKANALDAVTCAAEFGASGMLVTEWGDNGHLQPPAVMLPALTYAAAVAWCREANEGLDVSDPVGEVYAQTGVVQPNGSALHDAVAGGAMGAFGEPTQASLDHVAAVLDGVVVDDPERRQAIALARHGVDRLARRHGLRAPEDATLRARLAELREEQAACWLRSSRPGGLADSLAKLDAQAARDGLS